MVQHRQIEECPIIAEDVDRAIDIHGKDVGLLKGKTTRHKPMPVIESVIPVPKRMLELHKKVFLAVDLFYVNNVIFLLSYSRRICLTTAKSLTSRKITGVFDAYKDIHAVYRRHGFIITTLHADSEFAPLGQHLAELDTPPQLLLAARGDHVREIERRIRVVKERTRAMRHSLPFNRLPVVIVMYMVLHTVRMLTYFPQKGGVSETLSPKRSFL
jgi:hypothetical protein